MILGKKENKLVAIPEKGFYAIGKQVYHEGLKGIKRDLKKSYDNPKISQRQKKLVVGKTKFGFTDLKLLTVVNFKK